ncbi:glutathione S-transferase T1-like [Diospyros lotus]|uniref:glutathione S-transferase T1-like n=1 Tax=Diospyros lotus TaxID=55363 RepID=UPI002255B627|nr:glutathione S-transferase T1-like [Diospyros lotus]
MELKVYADRMSQPARAVLIFCKMNGIEFEEIKVDFIKRETVSPQFKAINPVGQVPVMVHGGFKLFESNAILKYLAHAFPGVADHWYPTDLFKRARIDSVLDWYHLNLRNGIVPLVQSTALARPLGREPNPQVAAQAESILPAAFEMFETFWLEGDAPFLLGNTQPSIADLNLVCEIMQLELLDDEVRDRILGPHKRVKKWMEDTKDATMPYFEEMHALLFETKASCKSSSSPSLACRKPPAGPLWPEIRHTEA